MGDVESVNISVFKAYYQMSDNDYLLGNWLKVAICGGNDYQRVMDICTSKLGRPASFERVIEKVEVPYSEIPIIGELKNKINQLKKENEELKDCIENNRPISFKGNLYITTGCSYKSNDNQQEVYELKELK